MAVFDELKGRLLCRSTLASSSIGATNAQLSAITLVLISSAFALAMVQFFRSRFNPKDKHCYIGGGSQGLGLSLACLLTRKGAHVTIVSRSQKKLDEALLKVQSCRQSPSQKLTALAYDLSSPDASEAALEAAGSKFEGRVPDYVFCCAGASANILGYFVQLTPDQLRQSVDLNYWTAVWTTQAAARRMVKQGVKGSIILTSSVIGFFGLPGYAAYSPVKHALRGLAESLRLEFLLYGINVHCYFPATMYTPGYEEEEKCKPVLTKIIEEADSGLSPDQCASRLVKGIDKGQFLITSDPIGHLFRNTMTGAGPISDYILGPVFALVGRIALPVWRKIVERQIKAHTAQHDKEVVQKLKGEAN